MPTTTHSPSRWLALTLALFAGAAAAQTFPAKQVRSVVPFTAGGGTDIAARVLAQKLTERTSQTFLVDNRPGASGIIGTELVAKSAPDGYTLFHCNIASNAIAQALYAKLPYDALRDFAPVSRIGMTPNVLIGHPSMPADTLKAFVAHARANPGKVSYGSSGVGASPHLSMELFKTTAKIDVLHVAYKGASPALADVIGGQIAATIDNLPPYLPQVKVGKIRGLAVTSVKRTTVMPDIPTIAESAVAGYSAGSWFGLVAPAGTPKPIIDKLAAETQRILKLPDVAERVAGLGAEAVGGTPEQFAGYIKSEIAKWAKVVKEANVELQ
mgnify:CR=1 FL=1